MGLKIDVVDSYWKAEGKDGFVKLHIIVNNVAEAVAGILKIVKKHKGEKITRLRFFGHGIEGSQFCGVKCKDKNKNKIVVEPDDWKRSIIGYARNKHALLNQGELAKLKGKFAEEKGFWDSLTSTAPPAVVELRGCSVGGGEEGKRLMKWLSQLWQVGVRAAEMDQLSGDKDTTNQWEGTVLESVNGAPPQPIPDAAARN